MPTDYGVFGDPYLDAFLKGVQRPPIGQGAPIDVPPEIPYLQSEEEESVLRKIGSNILGGAAYVGSILDKPGRAVRGLLGGNLRESLAFLPFSDTLGITKPEQQISGRKILEGYGLLSQNQPGLDFGDVLGFGTELSVDPLTYLGIGALSKSGQAASKAGSLAPTLAGRIKAGQAGLASFGLPFTEGSIVGTGPTATKVAELLGTARKSIGDSPVGVLGSAFFEKAARGATNVFGRQLSRDFTKAAQSGKAVEMESAYDFAQRLQKAGLNTPEGERILSDAMEGLTDLEKVDPVVKEFVQRNTTELADQMAELDRIGADVGEWTSKHGIKYSPRYATGPLTAKGEENVLRATAREMGVSAEFMKGREKIFDVPGGRGMLNDMSLDPMLRPDAGDLPTRQQHVLSKYLGWNDTTRLEYDDLVNSKQMHQLPKNIVDPVMVAQRDKALGLISDYEQAEHLADMFGSLDKAYIESGNPLFASSVVFDSARRKTAGRRAIYAGNKAHEILADAAVYDPIRGVTGEVVKHAPKKEGFVKLEEALDEIGLKRSGAKTTQTELLSQLEKLDDPGQLSDMWVPRNTVDEITRTLDSFKSPEYTKPLVRVFDWLNNMFKAGVYAPWPASTVRDFSGGAFVNLTAAAKPAKLFSDYKVTRSILEGKLSGISRESADKLVREAAAHRAVEPGLMGAGEIIGDVGGQRAVRVEDLLRQMPGETPISQALRKYVPKNKREALAFWETKGVGTPKQAITGTVPIEDVFAPVRGGRATKEYADQLNRLALFKNLTDDGFSAAEAAKHVRAAHVDYANLTDFERTWAKRVVPFYSFTRHMLPYTVQELIHKPGGLWATMLKAEHRTQQEAGFTPEYLTQGLALPVGQGKEGTTRFLTTLGLPFEAPLEFLRGGPGAPQRNLMSLLGQTSPIIKGPLEFATGKQFFSGRDLGELYGITGVPGLDQLIANSPASRLASSIRTIADPRKSLAAKATNLLTGARITDVDLEKSRDVAIGDSISRLMKQVPGSRTMTRTYVPKDLRDTLNQDQLMLLGLQRTRLREARERAKEAAEK